MVDMRNHGESPWADEMSYPAMAEDLADAVERLCGGHAVVLGHSMGGKAVMALALSYPELLAGAIVADIAPVTYDHTHTGLIRAMRAADLSGVTRRSQGDPLMAHAIPDPNLRAFILQNLVVEDGRARWRLNLPVLEQRIPDLVSWPQVFDKNTFSGPSFFVFGGVSEHMKSGHAPRVRALFPDAVFREIAGAGHWLHAEKPAEFLAAIDGWLDTLEG